MKYRISKIQILTLAIILFSTTVIAAPTPELYLDANNSNTVIGEEFTVDILVKESPMIYGVDINIAYDPALLEVVDTDEKTSGVQMMPGDFLNPASSFFIQNRDDSQKGRIYYTMSLLNPATEAGGDGLIAKAVFRPIAEGKTGLIIEKGQFGTRSGKTINPAIRNPEKGFVMNITKEPMPVNIIPPTNILIFVSIGIALAIMLAIFKIRSSRRRRKMAVG